MVLQRTTGANNEEEDVEDDKEDENYEDNITGKHKKISQKQSFGMAEYLDY